MKYLIMMMTIKEEKKKNEEKNPKKKKKEIGLCLKLVFVIECGRTREKVKGEK